MNETILPREMQYQGEGKMGEESLFPPRFLNESYSSSTLINSYLGQHQWRREPDFPRLQLSTWLFALNAVTNARELHSMIRIVFLKVPVTDILFFAASR
jgi:hypothetical protein